MNIRQQAGVTLRVLREREVRQKHLDAIVSTAQKRVRAAVAGRQPLLHLHFSYGASAIHPRPLVTWYLFDTDADWEAAKRNGLVADIERLTRQELSVGGYPSEGVKQMTVSFTSDEDIRRHQAGGDYWAYFK